MLVPVVDECMIIPIAPYTGASVHLVFRLIFANFNKINKYMPFCRPTEALTQIKYACAHNFRLKCYNVLLVKTFIVCICIGKQSNIVIRSAIMRKL